MPRKRLVTFFAAMAVVLVSTPRADGEGGGAIGGGGNEVVSWVVSNGPGGGVSPPPGELVCSEWARVVGGQYVASQIRIDAAGLEWFLMRRVCGAVQQFVWVPNLPSVSLGSLAFDRIVKLLPVPVVVLSPDVSVGGYVNFESWLSVLDPGVVSASASVPGLSATAVAKVRSVVWRPGDGSSVSCVPFGVLPPSKGFVGPAPCGHTFGAPSTLSAAGFNDGRFHGSVSLVWSVSWSASDGSSGVLGDTLSTVPVLYRVREIQTIGVGG